MTPTTRMVVSEARFCLSCYNTCIYSILKQRAWTVYVRNLVEPWRGQRNDSESPIVGQACPKDEAEQRQAYINCSRTSLKCSDDLVHTCMNTS